MPGSRIRSFLAAAVVAAASCGGDPGTSPPPAPPPGPPPPPPAPRLIFSSPIAGTPMAELFYGAYRDQGGRDYECGPKYYAGHTGTDILLRNFTVQDSGVAVLAAAAGRVVLIQDGMFDRSTQNGSGGFGNHIVIEHAPSFVSIYGHLRFGSIRVGLGVTVNAGDTLALVGSSGNSNWPHLHFEVRENGPVVDPFVGPCNPPNGQASWLGQLSYQNQFRVLEAGLTTRPVVSFADLLERPADQHTVKAADGSFLVWLNLFNVRAASIRAELRDAGGTVLSEAGTGSFTTFSVRFFTVRFAVQTLGAAGRYTVVVLLRPQGSDTEAEIHRQEFDFDPGAVPAPGALHGMPPAPVIWIGPDGGDRGPDLPRTHPPAP